MTAPRIASDEQQPKSFTFDADYRAKVDAVIAKYPAERKRSAVMPMLDLAQRQNGGWVSRASMDHIAEILDMAPIRVYEVASFYTMYNLAPVGKNLVQVCRTTPCWLRGSDGITDAIKTRLGVGLGETTADGLFTLIEVECLGACCNAPMVQINDDYYEDLTPESVTAVIDALAKGETPKAGSQSGRKSSEPVGYAA